MEPRSSWIRSIAVNIIILVTVMVFTQMSYETNDDYAISSRIASGDVFVGFVDFVMSSILVYAQKFSDTINIFVLFQVVLSFSSLVVILRVFMDEVRSRMFMFCLVLLLAVFAFDLYSVIQFTKTSAAALCAGMLLTIHSVTKKPADGGLYGRIGTGDMVIGLVLIYLGAGLRIANFPIAVGFAGIFLIMWVVENRKDLLPCGYLSKKRVVSYLLIMVIMAGAAGMFLFSTNMNTSTDQLRKYQEYNNLRSSVIDFSQFSCFDEYADEYRKAGLDKNDVYLVDNWYLDYDGAASVENLREIEAVYDLSREEKTAGAKATLSGFLKTIRDHLKDIDKTGIHILMLAGIAIVAFARYRLGYFPYIIALGVAAAGIYIALYHMGRLAYRATFLTDLSAVIWMLYPMRGWRIREVTSKMAIRFGAGAACVLLAWGVYMEYGLSSESSDEAEKKIRPEGLTRTIEEDADHMYVFSPKEKKFLSSYADPMKRPEGDENVITFGSWGTKSPYVTKRLAAYGLNDLFEGIIDNDKVYVIEDKNVERMEEYLNKWYSDSVEGREIRYVKKDEVDGYSIWKVASLEEKTKP